MKAKFALWQSSCKESFEGAEYGKKSYDRLEQRWPGAGSAKKQTNKKNAE